MVLDPSLVQVQVAPLLVVDPAVAQMADSAHTLEALEGAFVAAMASQCLGYSQHIHRSRPVGAFCFCCFSCPASSS